MAAMTPEKIRDERKSIEDEIERINLRMRHYPHGTLERASAETRIAEWEAELKKLEL